MANLIVIFILGIISGGFVVYFFVRAYWAKRLLIAKQTLLSQYDSDLDRAKQRYRTLETVSQRWLVEKAGIEQQLEAERRDRTLLQTQYEAQLEKEKRDRVALQADYGAYRREAEARVVEQAEKGVNLAIEQSREIETEKQALQKKVEQLAQSLNDSTTQIQQLQEKLKQEKIRLEAELKSAYENSGLTFASITSALFKNIVMQRNSALEIDKNKGCANAILLTLRAIDDQEFRPSKRVHATNKVWCESTAPGLKMMRIYFRINKPVKGKCEVLISHKKDPKTQSKDIDWMKNHSS